MYWRNFMDYKASDHEKKKKVKRMRGLTRPLIFISFAKITSGIMRNSKFQW